MREGWGEKEKEKAKGCHRTFLSFPWGRRGSGRVLVPVCMSPGSTVATRGWQNSRTGEVGQLRDRFGGTLPLYTMLSLDMICLRGAFIGEAHPLFGHALAVYLCFSHLAQLHPL